MTDSRVACLVGRRCGEHVVTIDRAPVSNLADVLGDRDPVHHDVRAARAAGFADVPAPPTYPFVMLHWGERPELLDHYALAPVPPNPFTGVADQLGHIGPVMAELSGLLGAGMVLHAEQDFEYHRTPVVGDTLRGAVTITDAYRKASGDTALTFVVIETAWVDAEDDTPVVTTRFTAVHQPRHQHTHPQPPQ